MVLDGCDLCVMLSSSSNSANGFSVSSNIGWFPFLSGLKGSASRHRRFSVQGFSGCRHAPCRGRLQSVTGSGSGPKSASSSASCSESLRRVADLGDVVAGAGLLGAGFAVLCLVVSAAVGGGGVSFGGVLVPGLLGAGLMVRHIHSYRWNALCRWVSSIGPGWLASPIAIPLRGLWFVFSSMGVGERMRKRGAGEEGGEEKE